MKWIHELHEIKRDDYEVRFQEPGKEHVSCTVLLARSQEEANETWEKHRPDVVVLR